MNYRRVGQSPGIVQVETPPAGRVLGYAIIAGSTIAGGLLGIYLLGRWVSRTVRRWADEIGETVAGIPDALTDRAMDAAEDLMEQTERGLDYALEHLGRVPVENLRRGLQAAQRGFEKISVLLDSIGEDARYAAASSEVVANTLRETLLQISQGNVGPVEMRVAVLSVRTAIEGARTTLRWVRANVPLTTGTEGIPLEPAPVWI